MAFDKPEIAALRDAAHTIEVLGKPYGPAVEEATGTWDFHHAYDLDE